mgnify:CR=1 FL=1
MIIVTVINVIALIVKIVIVKSVIAVQITNPLCFARNCYDSQANYISFGIGSNKKPPGIDNSNYGGFLH